MSLEFQTRVSLFVYLRFWLETLKKLYILNMENNIKKKRFLYHTANPHWLSLLHMVMHMFQDCSLNLPQPLVPLLCPQACPRPAPLSGALWHPRGVGWGDSRRRFKREGTHIYLWLIHAVVWQKPTRYCKAIILQLRFF